MKLLFKTEDYLDDDFIVSSKRNMESLAESIKCKRATLFLGAGVSVNVGLPTWPELLSELYLNLALLFSKEKENPIFNNMVNNNHKVFENINAIEAGEYIHTILESRAFHSLPWSEPEANINGKVSKVQMVSIMRDVLTRRFKEKEKVGYDAERWSILDAICDFTSGMNGIRNIVTYNFDDCLEYALLNRCNKKDVLSHGMMAVPTLNSKSTNIYHVHGRAAFLCHQDTSTVLADNNDGLIFCEHRYYEMQTDTYNTSNTTQAYFLNSTRCFFVGMSMQDFSMRRILHGLGKNTKNELSFEQKKFRQGVYSVEDNNVGHIILYPLDPILSCIPEVSYEDNKEVDSENLKKTISIILRPLTGYLIKNNLYPIYSTYSDIRKYLRQILSMTICEDGVNNTS